MKNSTRRATKRAAKARLSGAIPAVATSANKKIVFGGDGGSDGSVDEALLQKMENGEAEVAAGSDGSEHDGEEDDSVDGGSGDAEDGEEDDDAVEEVGGAAARASTRRLREAERTVAQETAPKKKRRKKTEPALNLEEAGGSDSSESEDEDEDEEFTAAFFEKVDSARADQLERAKMEKRQKKRLEKRQMGKHTTFVVDDDLTVAGAARARGRNIEVVPIGGSGATDVTADEDAAPAGTAATANDDVERQILLSATLGSAPSKAATLFARGSMEKGTPKERSCESRKRTTKNEETWKRSRKANVLGSRPGKAAALFVRRR